MAKKPQPPKTEKPRAREESPLRSTADVANMPLRPLDNHDGLFMGGVALTTSAMAVFAANQASAPTPPETPPAITTVGLPEGDAEPALEIPAPKPKHYTTRGKAFENNPATHLATNISLGVAGGLGSIVAATGFAGIVGTQRRRDIKKPSSGTLDASKEWPPQTRVCQPPPAPGGRAELLRGAGPRVIRHEANISFEPGQFGQSSNLGSDSLRLVDDDLAPGEKTTPGEDGPGTGRGR